MPIPRLSRWGIALLQRVMPSACQKATFTAKLTLLSGLILAGLCMPGQVAHGQMDPLPEAEARVQIDSGWVAPALRRGRHVVFAQIIHIPDTPWMRLRFDQAVLGAHQPHGQPTVLRITSLLDGAVQTLDHTTLRQWKYTSAYFNGDMLLLEVIADGDAAPSRISLSRIIQRDPDVPIAMPRSICGEDDERELSEDPRVGRLAPTGCTAWIIDDELSCLLTAGHCGPGGTVVVQFNVPLSTSGGSWNHPPPSDQYAIDIFSRQTNGGQGTGDDWAYFGCFPNSETGLSAYEAQQDCFHLTAPPGSVSGQSIRITGYGTTSSPVPPSWNAAQKTHVGPFVSRWGTTLRYATDTTGGNSGSPVIHEQTGHAIGIHTHGGCNTSGGNHGTSSLNAALQHALANPGGICKPAPPLLISLPDGAAEYIQPSGGPIVVSIISVDGAVLDPSSPMLHLLDGGALVDIPMEPITSRSARGERSAVDSGLFSADLPDVDCGSMYRYFISARTTADELVWYPERGAADMLTTIAAASIDTLFHDDFETDMGWTIDSAVADGEWERGIPVGGGSRGDPPVDADGSGRCYLTGNWSGNSDVDEGSTILTSPLFDGSHPDTIIAYWTWFSNNLGANPESDVLVIQISDDDGETWHLLEEIGPSSPEISGGWFHKMYRADRVAAWSPSATMRLRIIASDLGPQAIVEAAFDGVRIIVANCDVPCEGDANDDGVINVTDLLFVIANWGGDGSAGGDVNQDGIVNVADLLLVISHWGATCNED